MIFICEDDEGILNLVSYGLEAAHLQVRGFSAPSAFWEGLKEQTPSCIVLDIMLPEESGLEILQKLRANQKLREIPVIILTAQGQEIDIIRGLDKGADDYLTKPFSVLELIARIKAILRRSNAKNENQVIFKKLVYSKDSHSVWIDNKQIHLTLKEFELLGLFLSFPNRIFSREELLESIWGYNIGGTRTIDIHINTLRSKLGEYGAYIKTTRGVGYHFSNLES